MRVKIVEEPNKVILEKSKDSNSVVLKVSVIVEAQGGEVLLTRRSKELRAFPGVWVPPGGYVDKGETIVEAGIREVKEETGLNVSPKSWFYLGIWESVYPASLSHGFPKRHSLVFYLHIQTGEDRNALTTALKFSPAEVDQAAWLTKEQATAIVDGTLPVPKAKFESILGNGERKKRNLSVLLTRLPIESSKAPSSSSSGTKASSSAPSTTSTKSVSSTATKAASAATASAASSPSSSSTGAGKTTTSSSAAPGPSSKSSSSSDKPMERVSTGTRFALHKWLKAIS